LSKSPTLRDGYKALYEHLKSERIAGRVGEMHLPEAERKAVESFLKNLPHPSVATPWDVYDVANGCLEGSVPGLGGEAVRYARELMALSKKLYPMPGPGSSVPVPPQIGDHPTIAELAKAVAWGNNLTARLAAVAVSTNEKAVGALKTQCPFCLEEMALTIDKDEAVLRCVGGATPKCRKTVWRLFQVTSSEG